MHHFMMVRQLRILLIVSAILIQKCIGIDVKVNQNLGTSEPENSILEDETQSQNHSRKVSPSAYPNLDGWNAPHYLEKNYPYYLSGIDYDGRPVCIAESGRWNLRKVVEDGPKSVADFRLYLQQLMQRMEQSVLDRSTADSPVRGLILVSDLEGLDFLQITHLPTVAFMLQNMAIIRDFLTTYLDLGINLNTNAVAHTLTSIIRPAFGQIMEKIEIYGTQRSKWQPQLLKHIPKDQLPPWYGGPTDWKALSLYG